MVVLVIYWIVPGDLIPDAIPIVGYFDDILGTLAAGGGLLSRMDD